MPEFICRLGTEGGEITEKRFSAESRDALKRDLEGRGYYIFKIRPAMVSLLPGAGIGKIKPDDFIIFNQEFKALLAAGLPAKQSLEILHGRQGDSELGRMLKEVREAIETGSSLSDAFAVHRKRLPAAYVSTLVAGERSGDLPDALQRFIDYSKLTNSMRKHFRRALYYPIFLLGLSAALVALMLVYVLPEFAKFYEGLEDELPAITLVFLGTANFLRNYFLIIIAVIVILFGVYLWWRRTERGERLLARLKLRMPLTGELNHKYHLTQLYFSLAVMLRGGMPLITSLEDLSSSAANPLVADGLRLAQRRVSEGDSLHSAIGGTVLDRDLAAEMIQVGERTGALPEMLDHVATFYDEEVRTRLAALLSLVEPVLLVIMAALIGTLLFSMYYPLFSLLGRVGM